jgi:NADH dehydrogenase FAD-containing subunit
MAAEMKLCHPSKTIKLIHSHSRILNSEPLPTEFMDVALKLLIEAGVEPVLSERVVSSAPDSPSDKGYTVVLQSGKTLRAGKVIWAVSRPVPTGTYLPPAALHSETGLVDVVPRLHLKDGLPNHDRHYFAGDMIHWSGIKRCGAAMAMAQLAITNIHQSLLASEDPDWTPTFVEAPEVEPMIGLAVGKKAATYYMGVVDSGEQPLKDAFGDDLGLSNCWNHMQLDRTSYGPEKEEIADPAEKPLCTKTT